MAGILILATAVPLLTNTSLAIGTASRTAVALNPIWQRHKQSRLEPNIFMSLHDSLLIDPFALLPAEPLHYIVQRGDRLQDIAIQFDVPMQAIISLNKLANPDLIYPGDELMIPVYEEVVEEENVAVQRPSSPLTQLRQTLIQLQTQSSASSKGGTTFLPYTLYIVQRGDSLAKIGERFGIETNALIAFNQLANPRLIYAGTPLHIPRTSLLPPVTPTPVPLPTPPPPVEPQPLATPVPTVATAPVLEPTSTPEVTATAVPPPPTPDAPHDGPLIWPVESRSIVQYYHYGHPGIDIVMAEGSAVAAAAGGVVEVAGWHAYGYGNVIVIDDGHGVRVLYAHLSEFEIATGDTVTQGQLIGLSGNTGYSTMPHLHMEVVLNGQLANPCDHLPDGC
jgi:murein DD-endopeptidase MepM/ murein hydrolase activator NlpD